MIASTGTAMLSSVYPAGERGKALGMVGLASYAGMSAGPSLGGILIQYFGWRSLFGVCVLLGITSIVIVLKYLKTEWAEAQGERFDITGTLIYCVSLAALMCGFTFLNTSKGMLLLVAGAGGIMGLGLWVAKAPCPIVNIFLFKANPVFVFSILAALVNYGITIVITYLLSLYLQYILGLSPQYAGFVLITQPVLQALFSPLAGGLSDRMEPGLVSSLGMTLNGIGLFLLIFLNEHTPLALIILCLLLQGLGCAFFISPNQNAVLGSVEKSLYGVAYGLLATMRFIGQMVTMGIATLSFIYYIGNAQITPQVYPLFLKSIQTTFIIMTVLCFLGVYAARAGKSLKESLRYIPASVK